MGTKADLKDILSPTAGVILPGAQAALTGIACGVIAGSIARMTGGDILTVGGLAAGLGFGGGLLFGLSWWRARVSAILGELQAAALAYPAETVRLEVYTDQDTNYPAASWLELDLNPQALTAALQALAAGADLSMSSLAGRGKPLSRAEFCTLRDALIAADLAYWANPRAHAQGCELNLAGKHAVIRWAGVGLTSTTPPELDGGSWQALIG